MVVAQKILSQLQLIHFQLLTLGNDTNSICQGDSVLLDAGAGHTNYLWSTGDTTQTIYASTSGSYSVTVGNGTAVSNSNSLSFDGQDDYAFIPDSPDLNFGAGDITYECWVKLPQTNHSMQANIVTNYITNTTPLFGLYVGGTTEGFYEGRLGVHYRTNQANSETNCISTFRIDDNLWHHVAALKILLKDSIYLYIDGVLNNREIVIIGDNDTYQGIVIGGNHLNRYLNSNIIQLSAWNRALTQSEIRSHMSCPPTGNETSLVGYWNFNEGSGNTVTDLTSNGNNGTINGASWSTQTPNQYCNNCTATDSVYVQVQAPTTLDLGSDTTLICAGTSETLDAGTGFSSYSWSDGSTNQTLDVSSAGTYTVTGTDANGCSASDSVLVNILTVDIAQNDTTICEGDSLVLLANASQTYTSGFSTSQLTGTLNNGLLGYWPFNGNANDESGNGNDGTVNGVTLTNDRFGNANSAYDFDGINDFIQVSNSNSLSIGNNGLSISLWVKNDAIWQSPRWLYMVSKSDQTGGPMNGPGYIIRSGADGGAPFHYTPVFKNNANEFGLNSTTIISDTIEHLCLTYDNSITKLYRNGIIDNSSNFLSGSISDNLFDLFFGSANNGTTHFFEGILDDIGIWNRALSSQEVQQLYYGSPDYTYSWSPSGKTTSSITVFPTSTTTYTVDVTSGSTTCQDSVTITVNQTYQISVDSTVCDSIQWDSNWLASSGTYVDTLQNVSGCDSIVTLNLTIHNSATGDTTSRLVTVLFGMAIRIRQQELIQRLYKHLRVAIV